MASRARSPELARWLSSPPSETTPDLLELARNQAKKRRPIDLVGQRERDAFVQPSSVDQRILHKLDGLALEAASEFEALQLSPVAPLGVCSAIAPTSQDRTLSANRGTEVVSDPTNVLAVECARRLAQEPDRVVRLCTLHQVLRAQPLPKQAGFSRHFRLFTPVVGGPARPDDGFEIDAIGAVVGVFDRLMTACETIGASVANRRARIFRSEARPVLAARARTMLEKSYPHIAIEETSLESTYYAGLRVMLFADAPAVPGMNIADVGVFDWIEKLLSNRRMRFVAGGFGLELVPKVFGIARA
ncbi:MAG: hypothetical protein HOV80_38835 [Polyangiaceae bacterium]|nr:hypothetical protein [Polyangiaceae bacterium]